MSEELGIVDTDDAQSGVIEAPVEARLLVMAGPGTGKTRTLLARAECLIERDELEQAYDLVIISFSRAAVQTVAKRVYRETDLGRLRVVTIDSLAGRILYEAGVQARGMDFDQRIAAATEVIDRDPPEIGELLPARHVLVDEAQDVIGVRALLVEALLRRVCRSPAAGFTVFGDPAQAIYDFQVGADSPPRLMELLAADELGTVEVELVTNYRMQARRLVELAGSFGAVLRHPTPGTDWGEVRREIEAEIGFEAGWHSAGQSPDRVREVLERPGSPRVAVLTRNNAEALRLGARLQRAGIDVAVQHRLEERGGAPWLSALFGDAEFTEVAVPAGIPIEGVPSWFEPPAEVGRVLRDARVSQSGMVDLRRLSSLIRGGACPEDLVVRREAAVTVSTIHQAKGLEFDTVVVVDDGGEAGDSLEASRVVYVAATRARSELLRGARLQAQGQVTTLGHGRAAVVISSKYRAVEYLEVKVSDSDADWAPADRDEFFGLQRFLVEAVLPGDRARLNLRRDSTRAMPVYDIVHIGADDRETVIGRTSRDLAAAIRTARLRRPPKSITGLVADIPDTAVLESAAARRLGLGEHGLHLRGRVYGLAWMDPS